MDTDIAEKLTATEPRRARSNALALFSVTWAAANLFHIWGASRQAQGLFSEITTAGVLHALIGVVAVALLLQPRRLELLVALAVLGPITVWFEAPFLGSHWIVVGFVDLAIVLAVIGTRRNRPFETVFFPLARWALIGFYSFAAFAKLNHAFFTPSVSCGTYYLDELAKSLGFTLHTQSDGGWTLLVPVGVAGIELSIPVLLLMRRTRHIGVLLGLLFHGFIAFDQSHLFSDFSSVLVALFLLFMPPSFGDEVVGLFHRLSAQTREIVRASVSIGCTLLLLALWYAKGDVVARLYADGIGWGWVLYMVAGVASVAWFVASRRPQPLEHPLSFRRHAVPRWMAIVPALVVLTGLSPYLELRTAYAFNMYSNLQTVDGRSNHLLVTRTLPLTDYQSDLVQIVSSSDPQLQAYAVQQFELPFIELRDYLSKNPSVAITYVRHDEQHRVSHASDEPDLVDPVPSWKSKLFAFRSVDETSPARCQPGFLAAL